MVATTQKRMTLEELRAKTAKAIIDATTFEKTPTYDMPKGSEMLFRVKKVIEGSFGAPMVVCSELRVLGADGKFAATTLKAYTQDGLTGPRISVEVKPGSEIRIPSFLSKRAVQKGLEFHPPQVYWASYIDDKKVDKGTFKIAAVDLVGTDFPEA
jgi:hypothetical protein